VLCADNNMQAVDCTTPAQYFHLLRRQMYGGRDRRGMRKPLVIFTPKSLLRHAKAVSTMAELTSSGFREVLADTAPIDAEQVTRVIFSSGKIYYDLAAAREAAKAHHVALVRIEQLYPFAENDVNDALLRYPLTAEVVWAQEEPRNMGARRFIEEQLQPLLTPTGRELRYVGRAESASPATGSGRRHQEEQAAILEEAMSDRPLMESRRMRVVGRR
jgi:2-oxoglutarate dehydrogenase E1 component